MTLRDTIFVTVPSLVSVNFNPNSISPDKPIEKADKNANLTITKNKDGTISAKCVCDTLKIKAQLKNEVYKTSQKSQQTQTETVVKEVKYIPLWVKILAGIGVAFIILIVYSIYKQLKKK